MDRSDVRDVVLPSDYRSERQHIFQSKGSFDWFLRRHRAQLVARQALLLLAGRWMVHSERCDAYLLETGAAAAQAQVT